MHGSGETRPPPQEDDKTPEGNMGEEDVQTRLQDRMGSEKTTECENQGLEEQTARDDLVDATIDNGEETEGAEKRDAAEVVEEAGQARENEDGDATTTVWSK